MDRFLALTGGQPLRSNDWDFIQDVSSEMLRSIIEGLKGNGLSCIVSGLDIDVGDPNVTVSEGFLFKDGEIHFVPAASFPNQGELYMCYLTPAVTTGEPRIFKDTQTKNVYQYRRYTVGYGTSIPEGSVAFPGATLLGHITSHILGLVPSPPEQIVKLATVTVSSGNLHLANTIVSAPGSGKAIKVIGLVARISPTTTLQVGDQDLNILYVGDESSYSVGSFPNSFVESASSLLYDMISDPSGIMVNSAVKAQLSDATAPSAGTASIKFYCYYTIITL